MTQWKIFWLLWTKTSRRYLLPPCMQLPVSLKMSLSSMVAHRTLLSQVPFFLILIKLANCYLFLISIQSEFTEIHGILLTGLIDLAIHRNSLIGGDDFKSGQTKMKSVLVDFLVGAGIKVPYSVELWDIFQVFYNFGCSKICLLVDFVFSQHQ